MAINKVKYGNQTLIDLSTDTVSSAEHILLGKVGHLRDGTVVTGTASGGDQHGTIWQDGQGNVHLDDESGIALQSKTATPSESQQVIEADEGYYALDKVTVGAISSSYVGSGVARRSSSDLTASGATVTVPAGYYSAQASKAVATGTAGTPTATKGTVSNHAVTVTPSVTNTTGYITGGTKTGTGVSVSASELVSGTYSVTSSGTKDVTNYASASVPAGTEGTPTATKGTVSNHSVTVTPSVTNTGGYISGSTKTGTAVTVSASELVSGTYSVVSSGTRDVTNYASISVPAGTEGTPTATKGSVYNHSISVTPSVDNVEGYIGGNTKTGTAVTVTASELVSGTKSITENGTGIDVTNYASVDVDVPTGGYTATITHTVGSTYVYPWISVNDSSTTYHADGTIFKFNYGDVFNIKVQGRQAGGYVYVNGLRVAAYQDDSTYTWTPPACDLDIRIETSSTGTVYINYQVLNITENGTYNVSGYGGANVNVTSVPSVVTGTFTPNSTDAGTAVGITIPYTGNGYPIEVMIDVDGGVDGNTTYAGLIDQYSMARIFASKNYQGDAPTYTGSGTTNAFRYQHLYKSSNTTANNYSGSNTTSYITTTSSASASSTNCIRFNSATALSIFVKSTSYGFSPGITYRYLILYSS